MTDEELLKQGAPLVYNLSFRLTGNASDAEDLAQDAMLRALKGLARFRGDSQLSTWLYRITLNTWKNRVRSEKRRGLWKMIPIDFFTGEDHDEEAPFKSDEPPLDSEMEKDEKASAVQKALMELDEDSRAILVLREIEGQSYGQIAQALDLPEGTVKSRLSRSRSALKEKLKSYAGH